MLRLTVSTEEYLMIGEDIRLIFLGGTKNHVRVMLDVPKEVNVVRSKVLERKSKDKETLPKYYEEPEPDKKYLRKKEKPVIMPRGTR